MSNAILRTICYGLKGTYASSEKLEKCVMEHATAATVAGLASGVIPGVGGVAASIAATGIVVKMYVSLGQMLNIKIGNGVLKTVASAVVADIAGFLAVNLAAGFALSFIPGIGTVAAGAITAVTNYSYVYLAGIIYLKMVSSIIAKGQDFQTVSESDLVREAKNATKSTNMKQATKDAKSAYQESK